MQVFFKLKESFNIEDKKYSKLNNLVVYSYVNFFLTLFNMFIKNKLADFNIMIKVGTMLACLPNR